ncbi:hypothetical protein, partial [Actinobacillus pleuropneumoniae]|uniref:hypothetical protein n=1 Tax=Actinobacillus pleuropneumoniae TaxID=715 RepID=UPI002279F9AB
CLSERGYELVYKVLILKVRQRIKDVFRMAIWTSAEEDNAFSLPSFSAYPQLYVTSIGLAIPQVQRAIQIVDKVRGMEWPP